MRAAISFEEQGIAARSAAEQLTHLVEETFGSFDGRCIAGYVAARGELDPEVVLTRSVDAGATVALPVCGPEGTMEFCPWAPGEALRTNSYGIGEPLTEPVPLTEIDVVLVPGVAFSLSLSRVGHGVGYYDRWFARCFDQGHQPLRWGFAHDAQIMELPPDRPWDVPMHRVITPTRILGAPT